MSECDRYLEMISQLVDGELPEPQKTELFAHLDGCANCRRVYDAFSAISLSLGETAAPEGFAEGVMAAVRTQGGHGSSRAKKPGKSPVRYMALAACIVLAVLATVRLALPSGSTGAASGEPQAAKFGVAAAPGEIDPRNSDAEADGAAPDTSPAEETARREDAEENTSGSAENGSSEATGGDKAPAVEQYGVSGGSAVQLDAAQITSIEIRSPDGDTTLTDGEDISLVAALLSPSGQAADWQELGEASYSVDINYAGSSEKLEVYVSGGSLVCATDGGGAYSAAGSPAEFLDALK
ncbi:MAG: anti-sigma factor family protein [Candidatus Scatomorpha sp.]|jgi:negative regulator of sigma E activity